MLRPMLSLAFFGTILNKLAFTANTLRNSITTWICTPTHLLLLFVTTHCISLFLLLTLALMRITTNASCLNLFIVCCCIYTVKELLTTSQIFAKALIKDLMLFSWYVLQVETLNSSFKSYKSRNFNIRPTQVSYKEM